MRRAVFCLIFSTSLLFTAAAQDTGTFASIPPQKLFDHAWNSTGTLEKLTIRAYLAKNYADTEFGLFSRAWIADHDGDSDAKALYSECIKRYPKFLYCLANEAADLTDPKEKLAMEQRGLAVDPTFDNFRLIRDIYFVYTNDLKDKESGDKFLADWEGRYPDVFVFPFIRAIYYDLDTKEYHKAEQLYEEAASKSPDSYEVASYLANLRLDRAIQSDSNKGEALRAMLDFARAHEQSNPDLAYDAYMYLAEKFKKDLKSSTSELYELAFKIKPTDDACEGAVMARLHSSKADALEFAEAAHKKLPHSSSIFLQLGFLTDDPVQARAYYEEGVKESLSPGEKVRSSIVMVERFLDDRLLDYQAGFEILDKLMQQPLHQDEVFPAMYLNRKEAADFQSAMHYLEKREAELRSQSKVTINETFFRQQKTILNYYLANEHTHQAYYEAHPFLLYWQKQFGQSLRTTINFANDSDVIPPSDYGVLDKVARLLSEKGADQYVFAIEGHTDNTGPDSVNQPLSAAGRHRLPCTWRNITESRRPSSSRSDTDRRIPSPPMLRRKVGRITGASKFSHSGTSTRPKSWPLPRCPRMEWPFLPTAAL